jgi:hypothetical protein
MRHYAHNDIFTPNTFNKAKYILFPFLEKVSSCENEHLNSPGQTNIALPQPIRVRKNKRKLG